MGRRAVLLGIAGAGVAAGAFSLHVARVEPELSFAGPSIVGAVALVGAGLALIACGLSVSADRFSLLLVAAGLAWFLLEWNSPGTGSALPFTIGLCLYVSAPAFVGHATLAYPSGRVRSPAERVAVGAAYAGAVLVLGVLPALVFNPASQGCADCPRNLLLVDAHGGAVTELQRIGVYLGIAWALALFGLVLARLGRGTSGRPVFTAGALYLVLAAATFAASSHRGFLWNGTLERRLWMGQAAALVGIAVAVSWSRLRLRRARATIAQLVVDLAHSPPPGGLRELLAAIASDPDLLVAYPVGESRRLVDADGRPADPADRPVQTSLVRDGRRVAVLAHARGMLDDEELVDEVTAAARLALENERLQAEVRARVEELRASRSRIVATGDAERKRLERDLHDGSQQRLVVLALSLRLLRSQLPPVDAAVHARLEEAEAELDGVIAQLRELAQGIFPAVLADGGLAVAVRALAEDCTVPIRVTSLPEGRFPPPVETAAFTVVAEAARAATNGLVVRGEQRAGLLVVEVETRDEGLVLDTVALEDRVGALDGRIALDWRDEGQVTIRAELPCAS